MCTHIIKAPFAGMYKYYVFLDRSFGLRLYNGTDHSFAVMKLQSLLLSPCCLDDYRFLGKP